MKLLEYQAKEIFRDYGIFTPKEQITVCLEEALIVAEQIGYPCVLKAQVPVGGRGKAGGVKVVRNKEELVEKANQIFGMMIKGCLVDKILVSQAIEFSSELYLSLTLDRGSKKLIFIISPAGGVEIEEISKTNPEMIFRMEIDLILGIKSYQARQIWEKTFENSIQKPTFFDFYHLLSTLNKIYFDQDATLVEINPLIISQSRLMALDAKILIDDNALLHHSNFVSKSQENAEETLQEKMAREANLTYISLDGDIACIVNGAGLAMATMDVVKHFGGEPANFLDIGGSSNPEKMINAFQIIQSNPKVTSILINIFGGITRCDDIAAGLIKALEASPIKIPLSVRLVGTNDIIAQQMMKEIGIQVFTDMNEAVKDSVQKSKEVSK